MEAAEAVEAGEQIPRECFFFAKQGLPDLVPVLLHLLSKTDEDDGISPKFMAIDEDEWKISMAAATSLNLLAATVADVIVQPILSFVESNIQSQDWHMREASVMAFGSILEGPNPTVLGPLVKSAFPVLLGMMNDPVVGVKDTCAWTLGRVCELLMEHAIAFLPQLVQVCSSHQSITPVKGLVGWVE